MFITRKIDGFLNGITMYRLLLYGLIILVAVGATFGLTGYLSISGVGLIAMAAILLIVCYFSNKLFAILFGATTNAESALITALILACILAPPTTLDRYVAIVAVGLIAMASKYVLEWRHKHIFNPAAIAAVIASLTHIMPATWWIGSPPMLIFSLVLGLLVVRKVRHFRLFGIFLVAALATMLLVGFLNGAAPPTVLTTAFLSWPLIFFGSIMVTEPSTMPHESYYQELFVIIVGVIFASELHFGIISSTPHMALILGNIFAFIVSPFDKFRLTLKSKTALTAQSYDYAFAYPKGKSLDFLAGQYLDWTLPHHHVDGRGNRRTFTIASSPTEGELHLGVKFYEPSSSYKTALKAMKPGDTIDVGQLAGRFTLPVGSSQELVFIAGGIGITPFRSIIQYIVDTKQQRKMTLFYLINDPSEAAYNELLIKAKANGLRVVYMFAKSPVPAGWYGHQGFLDAGTLIKELPKPSDCRFYISGPPGMVQTFKSTLHKLGVPNKKIITDYFPGY